MSEKFERAALQNEDELQAFIRLVKAEGVKSYLEIGSKFGGSLWQVGTSLPPGSTIVSVDLPHGDRSFKETLPHLQNCVRALKQRGYNAHLYLGDSTDASIVDQAISHGPFDLCFIDANHTEPYVRKDWLNYGQVSRIVAFHDIGWRPRPEPSKKMPIEVPKVWNELKAVHPKHKEIRRDIRDNGIGILWRW